MNEIKLLLLSKRLKREYKVDRIFSKYWDGQKPLRNWANNKLKEAFKELDLGFYNNNLRNIGLRNDQRACQIEYKMGTPEYYVEIEKATLIFENEKFKITGIIDYDMDTTLLKYNVTCKQTGLCVREAECCA